MVPIRLSLSFSEFLFSVAQRNPLPEHAPIPGSSSEAIAVSSTLGLDGELLAMDGVDQRHRTHRSDRVWVGEGGVMQTGYKREEPGCGIHEATGK